MAGMLVLSRNLPQNVVRLTSKVFEIKSFQVNDILSINVRYMLIYMFQRTCKLLVMNYVGITKRTDYLGSISFSVRALVIIEKGYTLLQYT
jgi:hypothetical protein